MEAESSRVVEDGLGSGYDEQVYLLEGCHYYKEECRYREPAMKSSWKRSELFPIARMDSRYFVYLFCRYLSLMLKEKLTPNYTTYSASLKPSKNSLLHPICLLSDKHNVLMRD
jgi:hypothetical protein